MGMPVCSRGHSHTTWLLIAVLKVGGWIPGWAEAASLDVPSDFSTVNEALLVAVEGDTVLVAPGHYTDSEVRVVGGFSVRSCAFLADGVTLRSIGGSAVTTLDLGGLGATSASVVLGVELSSDVTRVEGFSITGAPVGGNGITAFTDGRFEFKDCVLRNLDAGNTTGGGIAASGDVRIEECLFEDCVAWAGGGLYHANGPLTLTRSTFRRCGSIAAWLNGDPVPGSSVEIEDCLFGENWASNGGAVQISWQNLGAVVRRCAFVGNRSTVGGALRVDQFGAKLVEGCLFVENVAEVGGGGALTMSGNGTCRVQACTFWGNASSGSTDGAAAIEVLNHSIVQNSVVASSNDAVAVAARLGGTLVSSCNVYWDNAEGNGVELSPSDREVDPGFCSPETGDFTVIENSPCVEPGALGCGQIGAYGVGCGIVSVEPQSWSRIKALHR